MKWIWIAVSMILSGCSLFNVVIEPKSLDFDRKAAAELFTKRCQACHVIADEQGHVLAGKPTRNGPNLYALSSRTLAADPNYRRYGKSMKAARAAGLSWDAESLRVYLQNPQTLLNRKLGIDNARTRMAFAVKDPADAELLAQYLMSF